MVTFSMDTYRNDYLKKQNSNQYKEVKIRNYNNMKISENIITKRRKK